MTFPSSIFNAPKLNFPNGHYKILARTRLGLTEHILEIIDGIGWIVLGSVRTTAGDEIIRIQVFGGHLQQTDFGFLHTSYLDIPETVEEGYRRAFGNIRHIVHTNACGRNFVAVGNKIYCSNEKKSWKFVSDFLISYPQSIFGKKWWSDELIKPEFKRNIIMRWHNHLLRDLASAKKDEQCTINIKNNAAASAYMAFAWDLFVTQDNKAFQQNLVHRLKHQDQFQGALHELFVAATCVKAGYTIEFENERDSLSKHGEFIATYVKTGESVLVEAKSKHREGVLGYKLDQNKDENPKLKFISLINKAIEKKRDGMPLVIFIDLNLPPSSTGSWSMEWIKQNFAMELFTHYGKPTSSNPEGFNAVVFTNHPIHWIDFDAIPSPNEEVICISHYPKDRMQSLESMTDILSATKLFGVYPKGFLLN